MARHAGPRTGATAEASFPTIRWLENPRSGHRSTEPQVQFANGGPVGLGASRAAAIFEE